MRTYTLTNEFHGTTAAVRSKDATLTLKQVMRAEKTLCGIGGCTCGGIRGGEWAIAQLTPTSFELIKRRAVTA